jgi:integrase
MPRKPQWPPPIYPKHAKPGVRTFCRLFVAGKAKDVPLGPVGSNEAREAYARLCAELARTGGQLPTLPPSTAPTVAVLCARWQESGQKTGKELAQYNRALAVVLSLYGSLPADEFRSLQLEVVQAAMASGSWMTPEQRQQARDGGRPADWSRRVVNRQLVRVRTVWRWAERHGLVSEGRWNALRVVRGLPANARGVRNPSRQKATPRGELDLVLPCCIPTVGAMLELQWLAGMRSCEVRGLRTADVNTRGDVWLYTVRPEWDKNAWRENHGQRVVPLCKEAQTLLAPWLRPDDPEGYVFRPQTTRRNRTGKVAYKNKPLSDWNYTQRVRLACKAASAKAGRPVKIIPYGGRHACKMRVAAAAGSEAARAVLGQKHISTTEHYGDLDLELATEAARKLG